MAIRPYRLQCQYLKGAAFPVNASEKPSSDAAIGFIKGQASLRRQLPRKAGKRSGADEYKVFFPTASLYLPRY